MLKYLLLAIIIIIKVLSGVALSPDKILDNSIEPKLISAIQDQPRCGVIGFCTVWYHSVHRIWNKIAKAIDETFAESKCMPQGFRMYFVWNLEIKGMESIT